MTIQKRLIQQCVLWGLVLGGLVGCAMIGGPPEDLIAKNDHAGLASWYEQEAAHLRQHAKDELAMAEAYRKDPSLTHAAGGGMAGHKIDQAQHCETLAGMYTKAAEEADLLAKGHRSMLK
jgi:hypothetical protein